MWTKHIRQRMSQRGISERGVLSCLCYGRQKHLGRGVVQYFIGDKEVRRYHESEGVDLSPHNGLTVFAAVENGSLLTTFRSRKATKKARKTKPGRYYKRFEKGCHQTGTDR